MQRHFPTHEKLPFLKDRVAVNKEITNLAKGNEKKYGLTKNKPATTQVRDSRKFADAKLGTDKETAPTSADQALSLAKQHNPLLHQAVTNVRKTPGMGQTQPSYRNG